MTYKDFVNESADAKNFISFDQKFESDNYGYGMVIFLFKQSIGVVH